MNKRSHGEGSLTRRKNGTFLAQVSIEGRRVSKTFKLRKEAQEWITTINGQVRQGLTFESTRTTVDELMEGWLNNKRAKLRPATIESYCNMNRQYISPALGKLKLKDVSAARVQKFYSDLEKRGIGKRTIEMTHTILHGFLGHAHRLGLIAQNWAALVEVPRPGKSEMHVWDESQVSQFLQFVNADPLYRLAFSTGMRRGEIVGLQWKDIDWNSGMLHVRRQAYRPEGGGFIFQTPKTERGTRGIRLGRGMLEALRVHYNETIPLMQAIAGGSWQDYDLIFPTSRGTPKDGDTVLKEFQRLTERAGLPPIRFHDIRQSVQVLLTTYAHYIPDNQETAANLMDAITTPTSITFENSSSLQQIAAGKK